MAQDRVRSRIQARTLVTHQLGWDASSVYLLVVSGLAASSGLKRWWERLRSAGTDEGLKSSGHVVS